jgi:hypothetical protein
METVIAVSVALVAVATLAVCDFECGLAVVEVLVEDPTSSQTCEAKDINDKSLLVGQKLTLDLQHIKMILKRI